MKIGEAIKVFELNVLKQAGVMITPEQVGLKEDPIAKLQAGNTSFSSILSQRAGNSMGNAPTPPTPPADPTDAAAQTKYQTELLAYQTSLQTYNQRFMQMMLQQFQSLQNSISENQKAQAKANSSSDDVNATGGILGLFDS